MSTSSNILINATEIPVVQAPPNLRAFWMLMVPFALNIPCSLLVLSTYLLNRNYRNELHNHHNLLILPINLFYQLSNIAFALHFFRTGQLVSTSIPFRTYWGFIDWTFLPMQFWLFAWATVERHILIFHSHLLAARIKRLFVHYLPLLLIPTYCIIYYSFVIFLSNCQNIDPSIATLSFYPCAYVNSGTLYLYEVIANQIAPVFLVVIASVILLIRVIWQKYRIHQEVRWRQHRRMTIQLSSISLLYLLFPAPYCSVVLLNLVGVSISGISSLIDTLAPVIYYVTLLHPVVCFFSMTELQKVVSRLSRGRRMINPLIATLPTHRQQGRSTLKPPNTQTQ